jgi:hypothetical protein
MGESKQPTVSAKPPQRGQTKPSVKPISGPRDQSRNHAARLSTAQPALKKDEAPSVWHEVQQHSCNPNQRKIPCKTKALEGVIRDLEVKLNKLEQELQVQGSQYEKLRQDFGQTQAENNQLKSERDNLEEHNEFQRSYVNRYHYIIEQLFLPYAQERRLQFHDRTRDTLDFVLIPLLRDAQEAELLRDQVRILQNELLEREREKTIVAIPDERFTNDFRKLAAQIKTLSRLIQPHDGLDVVKTLGLCIMANGVAPHHWSGRIGRKLFIEAWIWSLLIKMVFQDPFALFGGENKVVANLWFSIFGKDHCHGWPRPSLPCEIWRCTTVEQMLAVVDENIITQGKTKECYLYLEQNVVNARASVIHAIETGLAMITPAVEPSQVLQIVNGAFTLAMHMSLQRSRLQIVYPKIGDSFRETEMKLQNTLEEEEITEHSIVAAIINPGLTKWGDVQGKNSDHRYDIVPALVRLQAPALSA